MRCPQCGDRIPRNAPLCPHCGHALRPPKAASFADRCADPLPEHLDAQLGEGRGCLRSFLVLIMAFLVVLGVLGLGAAGAIYGMRDRATLERRAAEEHYQKGLLHLERGELEIAIAELELAMQLNPSHEAASARLAEARKKLTIAPTATPALQQEMNAVYLDQLHSAHQAQDWPRVFTLVDKLLAVDLTYHRTELDQMLFDAFFQSGLQLANEDRLEEAIRLFDRALALQPTNAEAARSKQLATLYLAAKSFWGADWTRVLENLSALYRLNANYKDVRQLTYEAYGNYGDVLAQKQDWCGAALQYARALDVMPDRGLSTSRQETLNRCDKAASAAGQWGPSAPSGTFVGRIVEQTELESNKISIRGKVLDKEGKGIESIKVQIKAWDWWAVSVTDSRGQYAFDGLANPVTYTLTLFDRPCLPASAPGVWGKATWVDFREAR